MPSDAKNVMFVKIVLKINITKSGTKRFIRLGWFNIQGEGGGKRKKMPKKYFYSGCIKRHFIWISV
jgi:hypothetical protein